MSHPCELRKHLSDSRRDFIIDKATHRNSELRDKPFLGLHLASLDTGSEASLELVVLFTRKGIYLLVQLADGKNVKRGVFLWSF